MKTEIEAINKMLKVCKDEDLSRLKTLLTNLTTKNITTTRVYKVRYNSLELISVES